MLVEQSRESFDTQHNLTFECDTKPKTLAMLFSRATSCSVQTWSAPVLRDPSCAANGAANPENKQQGWTYHESIPHIDRCSTPERIDRHCRHRLMHPGGAGPVPDREGLYGGGLCQ